ncbi:GDP-mannose pyrophosphatase NudK [Mucilaginibacter myungsuensis]|uniref:GDP-mannose pyrophosphatase NudK n=1 Tax=Mucilaginibacter myungsuensis TaxID=649104 RepID=UPI001D163710|nr:GDP-mannose pyrophosphatase NudK [Mucilaginibacter myungsuensis]MDN3599328.1 GDP-mannose pyrophosphatase NudK [Mucilaginibacter myungsuensis]
MNNITITNTEVLSDNWYTLRKISYQTTDRAGNVTTQSREAYDRGNGAVIFLYNKQQGTVILTRQFRMPTYVNGNPNGMLIECCAGLLDAHNAEDCIRKETEEETGYKITHVQKVFEAYMSPGSVTEMLYFFTAEYDKSMQVSDGGGLAEENENIEVLEMTFQQAVGMIASGDIRDAKTIMLLQYAQIHNLLDR